MHLPQHLLGVVILLLAGLGSDLLRHILLLTLTEVLEFVRDELEERNIIVVLLQYHILNRIEPDHVQLPVAFVLFVEHNDILIEFFQGLD